MTFSDILLDRGGEVYNVRAYGATGDGVTDDAPAFQKAINACAAALNGGEVFVPPPPVAYLTLATVNGASNISLRGWGCGKPSLIRPLFNGNAFSFLNLTDVCVSGLALDAQQTGKVSGASLMYVSGCTGVKIDGNRLDNAREYAVLATNSSEVDILRNRVSGAAIHGILVGDTNGGTNGMADFRVETNRIYSCGTSGDSSTGKGISILGSGNTTQTGQVNGNIIRQCFGIGIELFANTGTGGVVQLIAVNDNNIERTSPTNLNMGISLGFASKCTADDNIVNGCYNGIENAGGDGNSVCGNTLSNQVQSGISVSGGTTNSSHTGNTISGAFQYGIHDNSSPTHNSGNVYSGGRITGAGGSVVARQIGMFINNGFAGQRFSIGGGMQITNCSGSGVYLFTCDTGIVAHVISTGNVTNAANAATDADIYFNLNAGQLDKIIVGPNIYGSFSPNQTATDAQASQTLVVGGFKKLAGKTIGSSQTTVAHGLSYTPNKVLIVPRSNATIWESQAADGTNVYFTASAAAQTADVYVA